MKRTILVTGGSRGIGLAIAERFRKEGFAVVICARDPSSLAAAAVRSPGLDCVQCDVSIRSHVDNLARHIASTYGAVDVLVNNAGEYRPGRIHEEADDALEHLMRTNLFGAYHLTKRLLPAMMARRDGTIFNMCSTASIMPYPDGGSYCISKHALLGFSKVLREEMKAHRVRVISVLPGATLTDSWSGTDLPAERFMPPDDIADILWNAYRLSQRTVAEEILLRPMDGDIVTS